MAQYFVTEDFRGGLDSRRDKSTTPPGSLVVLKNAVITRGGEIEQRKSFVKKYTLPAGTHGLAAAEEQLTVFGSAEAPAMPADVEHQRLQSPSGADMTGIVAHDSFDSLVYVVGQFSDDVSQHFYDGKLVDHWAEGTNKGIGAADLNAVAAYWAGKISEDDKYTASANNNIITIQGVNDGPLEIEGSSREDETVTVNTTTAGVAGTEGDKAEGTFEILGGTNSAGTNTISTITIDGVEILGSAVDWVTSNHATAIAVKDQINNNTSTPNYTAEVVWTGSASVGKVKIITTDNTDQVNTKALTIVVGGDVSVGNQTTMDGGVDDIAGVKHVATVSLDGAFSADDGYTIKIDDDEFGAAGKPVGDTVDVIAFSQKMYAAAGKLLFYSEIDNPKVWHTDGNGAGFLNMATEIGGQNLTGVSVYSSSLAVFDRSMVQVWAVRADDAMNVRLQILRNSGALAPKSIVPYGGTDVYYLSDSGIRSVRARDVSVDSASIADVGTPIDTLVRETVVAATTDTLKKSFGVIEPVDGRYLLAIGNTVYVFSFFPGAKVSAWSTWELPGHISGMVVVEDRLYVRIGDDIYLYGGDSGSEYDTDLEVVVTTPFLTAGKPATRKNITALDIAGKGTWGIEILTDPSDETLVVDGGKLEGVTYPQIPVQVATESTHFAIRLTSIEGPVALFNMAVHYEEQESD